MNIYFSDFPDNNKINVHQLLNNTLRIKDFAKMKSLREIEQKEMTLKMRIDFFKNDVINVEHNEKFV